MMLKLPHEYRQKVKLVCPVCSDIAWKHKTAIYCSDYCRQQASLVRRGIRKFPKIRRKYIIQSNEPVPVCIKNFDEEIVDSNHEIIDNVIN